MLRYTPIINDKLVVIAMTAVMLLFAGFNQFAQAQLEISPEPLSSLDRIGSGTAPSSVLQGAATFKENVEEDPLSPFYYPTDPDVMEAHPLKEWAESLPGISQLKAELSLDPNNVELNYQLGIKHYYLAHSDENIVSNNADKIYSQAIQYFLTAERFDPDSIKVKLALGSTYLAKKRVEDAGEKFQRALETDPFNPDVLERTGAYLSRQGNYTAAKAYLDKATELQENHPTAYFYKGYTVSKKQATFKSRGVGSGADSTALLSLQKSMSMHPYDPATLALLGHQQKYKGNTQEAVRLYREALDKKPGYMPASLGLADVYEARGEMTQSLEVLKKASVIHPNNNPIKIRIGDIYWKQGQLDMAAHYFKKMLMTDPDNKLAKEALADLHHERTYRNRLGSASYPNAMHSAAMHSGVGIEAKPGLTNVSFTASSATANNAGFSSVTAGQKSRNEYDGGLKETASNHHQRFQQAELLLDRYQFEQAEKAIKQAIQSTSTGQEAFQYGQLLNQLGLPDMAILALKKSSDIDGSFKHKVMNEIALARRQQQLSNDARDAALLMKKENPEASSMQLKNALHYNIRNAEAHYDLAMLLERNKVYSDAANHYYAFTQLRPTDIRVKKALKKIERLRFR